MSTLRIVHTTGLRYADQATASYNEVRMLPHTRDGQFVLQAGLEVTPNASQSGYTDYWDTEVSTFEVLTPHDELRVQATSVIDVRPASVAENRYLWEELAAAIPTSLKLTDYLMQTEATEPEEGMMELSAQALAAGLDVEATARQICRMVGEQMEYRRGVTGVNSTASEAWPARVGVCQDIAHVSIGVLRASGIPARYVSGYLHPDPAVKVGVPVIGESHAWVEWYAGAWRGFDPTNLIDICDRHVYVGHGRDYTDVAPLRGVYGGSGGSEMFVEVEITKLA